MLEFDTALEAQKVHAQIRAKMSENEFLRFKRDLWAISNNIDKMISELSSMEVKARQTRNSRNLVSQREKILDAIQLLDKLITFQILLQ
jgi:hypothetical protein